jgi:hypothetical protein
MARKALAWAVAALAVFHAWLFAGQVWDGTLLAEPGLLWRWAVAAVLVVGLEGLRRRGASLIRGRQALTIWLVAALLHGPAVSDRANVDLQGLPEVVVTYVTSALALGALAAGGAARRPVAPLLLLSGTAVPPPTPVVAGHGAFSRFSPRPPPIPSK